MWLSPEEARSDVILASATMILGTVVLGWLSNIPFYPDGRWFGVIELVLVVGLVPFLLARYRDGSLAQSFAITADQSALWTGTLVAAPIMVIEIARRLALDSSITHALFGRALVGDPTVGPGGELGRFTSIGIEIIWIAAFALCLWLFFSFVIVRSEPAFRSVDMDVTEVLRTFGLGAAAAGLVFGLIRGIFSAGFGLGVPLLSFFSVAAAVLIADRYVPPRLETTRAAMLAPAIIVLVANLLYSGGFLRGDLIGALHRGLTASAMIIAMSALIKAKLGWALIPIAVVFALWPTCATPLPFGFGAC